MNSNGRLNKYDQLIARWLYNKPILEFIHTAVEQWLHEMLPYTESLDRAEHEIVMYDCFDALDNDDLASLPDEWLSLLADVMYAYQMVMHRDNLLLPAQRKQVKREVSQRAVLWKLTSTDDKEVNCQPSSQQS